MVTIYDPAGLGQGLTGLSSALGQTLSTLGTRKFEKSQKEAEFKRQRDLEEEKRLRTQKAGTTLETILGELGESPNVSQIQGAMAQAIQEGVDPDLVKQFASAYAPIIKQQAQTQAISDYLEAIGLGGAAPTAQRAGVEGAEVVSGPQGTIYEQFDDVPNSVTQNQIDALLVSPLPQLQALGKSYDDRRRESRKNFIEDRNFHAKGVAKTQERFDELAESIPKRERVLQLARNAVESEDIGAFSQNRIADMIGGPIGDALRTKSGAEFGLALKENLATGLSDFTAKAQNVFLEKRLFDAFAKVGQKEVPNLAALNFLQDEVDLQKALLNAYDRLAEQDIQRWGYKRNDLGKRAREAALPEQEKVYNRSLVRNRQLQEREKGVPWMYKQANKKVERGTPLTPEMFRIFIEKVGDPEKALVRAKQLGYSVYSPADLPGGKL